MPTSIRLMPTHIIATVMPQVRGGRPQVKTEPLARVVDMIFPLQNLMIMTAGDGIHAEVAHAGNMELSWIVAEHFADVMDALRNHTAYSGAVIDPRRRHPDIQKAVQQSLDQPNRPDQAEARQQRQMAERQRFPMPGKVQDIMKPKADAADVEQTEEFKAAMGGIDKALQEAGYSKDGPPIYQEPNDPKNQPGDTESAVDHSGYVEDNAPPAPTVGDLPPVTESPSGAGPRGTGAALSHACDPANAPTIELRPDQAREVSWDEVTPANTRHLQSGDLRIQRERGRYVVRVAEKNGTSFDWVQVWGDKYVNLRLSFPDFASAAQAIRVAGLAHRLIDQDDAAA